MDQTESPAARLLLRGQDTASPCARVRAWRRPVLAPHERIRQRLAAFAVTDPLFVALLRRYHIRPYRYTLDNLR